MILESIVTTICSGGRVNIAPLGPIVLPTCSDDGLPRFCLRPYDGSRTCRNLLASGQAVIHVTDDVLLLARAAIGNVDPAGLVCEAENAGAGYMRLSDCHRWFAVKVIQAAGTPPLHELTAVCVAEGVVRPFFGFNRAKHAVIEAAILATRLDFIDADAVLEQMQRLSIPVEKTAGPDELQAFELIQEFVNQSLSGAGTTRV